MLLQILAPSVSYIARGAMGRFPTQLFVAIVVGLPTNLGKSRFRLHVNLHPPPY